MTLAQAQTPEQNKYRWYDFNIQRIFRHLEKTNEIWDSKYYKAHMDYVRSAQKVEIIEGKVRSIDREPFKRDMAKAWKDLAERFEAVAELCKEQAKRAKDLP